MKSELPGGHLLPLPPTPPVSYATAYGNLNIFIQYSESSCLLFNLKKLEQNRSKAYYTVWFVPKQASEFAPFGLLRAKAELFEKWQNFKVTQLANSDAYTL